ncbi:MAG: histidine kinase dimerization/phospho-acceptor domain-containing protein [Alphaproteobacteria bacterium]
MAVLDDRSLDSRLTLDQPAEELEGLVDQFNALLSRLQTAFSREKQFTADVAHELRTPLAELRNLAEVGRRWPDDQKLVRAFFGDVIEATAQMERIVVNLLALANGETCDIGKSKETFDLVGMLEEVWASRREGAMKKCLTFDYTGPERLCIDSACDLWFLILSNLFDNAVFYGLDDSEIACTIDCEEQRLILRLTNAQHDLVQQDLAHLFDRFWRKDPARAGGQHAGLGLTLVKAYADQLGLKVEARLAEPDIFEISLRGQVECLPDAPCECSAHHARTTEEGPGSPNFNAPA